jgi:hypothetical protein
LVRHDGSEPPLVRPALAKTTAHRHFERGRAAEVKRKWLAEIERLVSL